MAQPTYGTHRVKNPGLEDGVWITDGKNGFEIPESRYRENGYKPRVEELPWRSSTWEGGNAPWPSQREAPADVIGAGRFQCVLEPSLKEAAQA
jgi:hypothetical protein